MSAGSGILPTAETIAVVDDLKKNGSKLFYATFKVDGVHIVPDKQFSDDALKAKGDALTAEYGQTVWANFVKDVTSADGPRFGVIDIYYTTKDGRNQRKLTSVGWCPDKKTPAKLKMTFASTKTAFETKIDVNKKYQANDESDLEFSEILSIMEKV